jgi:Flagellar biosynthesis protein, FliO
MVGSNTGINIRTNKGSDAIVGSSAMASAGTSVGVKIGAARLGGLAGWLLGRLLDRLRGAQKPAPRLQLVERITLGSRQTLALIEAEGQRVLVATSPEGAPAFYAIDKAMGVGFGRAAAPGRVRARIRASMRASW